MTIFGNRSGKRIATPSKKQLDFSKKLINDNRYLLWLVNTGGLLLAFYCVHESYLGALGWIAGMVASAWAAHGAICSWYFSMAKSDHRNAAGDGLTFAIAQAQGFIDNSSVTEDTSWESPQI